MNLADSVKYVLKNKSQNIFVDFWKDDLGGFLKDIIHTGKNNFKKVKQNGFQFNFKGIIETGVDTFTILKETPKRVKFGFIQFREDFIVELDSLEDPRQKRIFCLKVIGALSRFAVESIYSVKNIKGIRRPNAFTQLILAELIFKICQMFVLRFIGEIEKQVSNPEELKTLGYFKTLVTNRERSTDDMNNFLESDDKATLIVSKLRFYILNGNDIKDK